MSVPTEEEQAATRDARLNRRSKRSKLGRAAGLVEQRIEEGEINQVKAALGELRAAFDGFSDACVSYEQFLVKETDLDAADAFLEQGRLEYIAALRKGNLWIKGESDEHEASKMTEKNDMSEIASLLAMPKLDVGTYDGNPVGYPAFMKIFKQSVKGISDNEMKLIHLLDGSSNTESNTAMCLQKQWICGSTWYT